MTTQPILQALAQTTDVLMFVTVFTTGWVLVQAQTRCPKIPWIAFAIILLTVLGWGAVWTWYPSLASTRLAAPPGGQAGAVVTVVAALVSLLILPAVRNFFKTAEVSRFVALGAWRVVYGAMLLIIGSLGGLPKAFFWSAGIGDILVGLWALSLLKRRASASPSEVLVWNALGLFDLLHVITLAGLYLRPFFLAHPELPTLNLLPLVGVPLFIALHILTLWGLLNRRYGTLNPV